MYVTKIFEKNSRTRLVSRVFDSLLVRGSYTFDSIELHVRDKTVSSIEDGKAVICIDYNHPFVLEGDVRGIRMLLQHELFRLMFKFDLPKDIEDVIIGREMLKRGMGDELFYLYYNDVLRMQPVTVEDYIRLNLPWIILAKHDPYNSELLKKQAAKNCKKKFGCRKLFDLLLDLSEKRIEKAVEEYDMLLTSNGEHGIPHARNSFRRIQDKRCVSCR